MVADPACPNRDKGSKIQHRHFALPPSFMGKIITFLHPSPQWNAVMRSSAAAVDDTLHFAQRRQEPIRLEPERLGHVDPTSYPLRAS